MSGVVDPYHRWLGIPPKDRPANHYRLLGVERFESDPEVIRDAAEQRMAHVRTYQLGRYSDLSQRILNELAAAKACLLDPEKKAAYDRQLPKSPAPSGKPETMEGAVGSPPPRPEPQLPERPAPRPMPSRLLPTAIVGIVLIVAIVGAVLMLMPNRTDRKTASDEKKENILPDKPEGKEKDTSHPSKGEEKGPPKIQVRADNPVVTVNKASKAANTGKYVGNGVKIASSIGTATQDDATHTWSWSYKPMHGPLKETVTITAKDGDDAAATTFELAVKDVPPTVSADHATVRVNKASKAANTGNYGDVGEDAVTITSSIGTVTQDDATHTWSWTYAPLEGPLTLKVNITATNGGGAAATTAFTLVVKDESAKPPGGVSESQGPTKPKEPWTIALPSGGTLAEDMLDASVDWRMKLFPYAPGSLGVVYIVCHTNGMAPFRYYPYQLSVQSIFTCRGDGSMHGNQATLDNDGQLLVLATYHNGKLDGALRLWNTNHVQLFYGQYKNGKKDGLVCYFQDGRLQLIQECVNGKPPKNHMVIFTKDGPSLSDEEGDEMNKAVQGLKDFEKEFLKKEKQMKERVMKSVRQIRFLKLVPLEPEREKKS
jgi:hypothetical protein